MTFLLRDGSRNAFDGDRNSGQMAANVARLCDQPWDEERLGSRPTVTCSGNAVHHAARVATSAVSGVAVYMLRRLMKMRLLDSARLFDRWWLIAIDGTLKDRGHETKDGEARHRYVLTASLVGPFGMSLPFMSVFMDMPDLVRNKADCEINAFTRLAPRLQSAFPRLPMCLLLDGLYAAQPVFDICKANHWKFIATLREGRQPLAYEEAVQTMMMLPSQCFSGKRQGEDGLVDQTLRWTDDVPFGAHAFSVLFSGEISPKAATLWVWVTNLRLGYERVYAIANHGGRARSSIENLFNVEKNGGFGLEHTFCANEQASQNYHLIMQTAYIIWQLISKGVLHKLVQGCRKITAVKLVELMRISLQCVLVIPDETSFGQLRFSSS